VNFYFFRPRINAGGLLWTSQLFAKVGKGEEPNLNKYFAIQDELRNLKLRSNDSISHKKQRNCVKHGFCEANLEQNNVKLFILLACRLRTATMVFHWRNTSTCSIFPCTSALVMQNLPPVPSFLHCLSPAEIKPSLLLCNSL
jgi:hypothetical protein